MTRSSAERTAAHWNAEKPWQIGWADTGWTAGRAAAIE